MGKIRRILLDMDDVLVGFEEGACIAHGVSVEKLREERKPGEWSLIPLFARLRGEIMSEEEFWRPILLKGEAFWFNLEESPWCKELLYIVRSTTDDWHIVSGPSSKWCHTSYAGKIRWLKQRLGRDFDKFIPTDYKQTLAKEGVLLIDDGEHNINAFREEGGDALIFPSQGNSMHEFAGDPVGHVREMLLTF